MKRNFQTAVRNLLLMLSTASLPASALADTRSAIEAYKAGQFEKAFHELEIEAGKGDPAAETLLASMYYTGQGTALDYEKAFFWSSKAAEQGNAQAQAAVGELFLSGHGVERNPGKARYWLQKSAAQGNARAKYLWTEAIGKRGKLLEPDDLKDDADAVLDKQGKLISYKVGKVVFPVPAGFRGPRILPPNEGGGFGVLFASPVSASSMGTRVMVWIKPDIPPIFRPTLRKEYLAFAKDQIAYDVKRQQEGATDFAAQPVQELTIANVPAAAITFSKQVKGVGITANIFEFALGEDGVEIEIDASGTPNAEELEAVHQAIATARTDPAFPAPAETWAPQQGAAKFPFAPLRNPDGPLEKAPVLVPAPAATGGQARPDEQDRNSR